MPSSPVARGLRLVVALLVALVALGCSTPDERLAETADGPQYETFEKVAVDPAVAALVPARVREAGALHVVMNVSSAPTKFYAADNTTIVGLNADLARALGRVFGVPVTLHNVPLDGIIPGLQAHRYDLTISSMSPTAKRLEVLDMVRYGTWGSGIAVKTRNPLGLSTQRLCGYKVAVQQGSIQESQRLPELNAATCRGAEPIEPVVLPSQNDALLQLDSGRVDAVFADSPVLAYAQTRAPDSFELIGEMNRSAITIGLPKGSDLTPAVQAGLRALMANGTYQRIFHRWGMDSSAITDPVVETP
ncbi:ABC transporter substrate-binding protein [Saccharopolyspora subtropica]|uniref:ABC transporter substrate-binding protein n=1 Tax=Saccharopolyspora thermophila TaxID=89367 RepID=A0A917JV51_9PSEU|nr:ABC transporter substrate-binding protein [Saccharopolyspora subtropica]GGI86044.1 ABC transporter substrate-binding protein [Saccharopolyspora subtropica]